MAKTAGIAFSLLVLGLNVFLLHANPQVEVDSSGKVFDDNFEVMWANDHFKTSENGHEWHLVLDQNSGSGFQSKHKYRFGWFSMKLKLVPGDSAGVVTAYYMSSGNDMYRDELDFEFLGNRSGEPYVLQTNVYCKGVGGREMRHLLWFDPTLRFHTYSILWNSRQIVFFVDRAPVRIHRRTAATGDVFPEEQPMYMLSSIWNADNWATRGGLDKINWAGGPFVSSYKKFHALGCKFEDPLRSPACASTQNWWDEWALTEKQKKDYIWVRRNYLIYDYCHDYHRYSHRPVECSVAPWD